MNITENELNSLRNTKNSTEWNAECDKIKRARQGKYPEDWYAKVVQSGLMAAVSATW